jgi:hypothetical protein
VSTTAKKNRAARAGEKLTTGWYHCAGSERMHYLTDGVPLCGKALTATEQLKIDPSGAGASNSRPKCADCARAHLNRWIKGGGFPL